MSRRHSESGGAVSLQLGRGQRVFMASAGPATIADFAARDEQGRPRAFDAEKDTPAFYVIEAGERVACVPIDRASETLRPLVLREAAEEMLSILRAAANEAPRSPRPLLERGRDVVHSGTPVEHARLLREMYGLPAPVSEAFGSALVFLSRLVLDEIAEVLVLERGVLEQEMRQCYPAAKDVL